MNDKSDSFKKSSMFVPVNAPGSDRPKRFSRWLLRMIVVVLVTVAVGMSFRPVFQWAGGGLETPAGFQKGVIHGVLMPLSWPALLMGRDVTIYALENAGRTYKLGYALGVNFCGLFFFGILFWRIQSWIKKRRARPQYPKGIYTKLE